MRNQRGALNILLIPFIVLCLVVIGVGYFAFWAYGSRQDYKDNVDAKVVTASQAAVTKEDARKDAQFAEAEKQPLKTYNGPEAYGSLVIQYPKTWSSYVDSSGSGQGLVDGYFYPGTVPAINDPNNNFALRIQVVNQTYSSVLQSFNGQQTSGKITATPYTLPKLPSIIGTRIEGIVQNNKQGSMVVLPLRSSTIKIWTEDKNYEDDFNNNILPNFTFSP